jgi:trans-aconitate methyltransferase
MLDPDRYDEVAEAFDRYSERTGFPITECLMEMTRVSGGDRLLDVACGSGIVTRRAAALIREAGKAVGIDLSPNQWSYAYTAPFDTAEAVLEWESIRTSAYRMRTDLDPARVEAFRQHYLREARERHDQHGVLGLTTGALFGVGIKRRHQG